MYLEKRFQIWLLLALLVGCLIGCGAAVEGGENLGADAVSSETLGGDAAVRGNLGVAGATCQSSLECTPPLHCLGGVCTEYLTADVRSSGDGVDAGAQPDVEEGKDSSEVGDNSSPSEDTASTNIFSDCEEMGISDQWAGTFMGMINFTVDPPIPGLMDEGALIVSGDLSFDIKCLDQKLVVAGQMDGYGEAVGEAGQHPYTSKLAGYYDPVTGKIEANLIEGVVSIIWPDNPLIKVAVYYEGSLEGNLESSGDFEGTWEGEETGNQLGAGVEAIGSGTWKASPVL